MDDNNRNISNDGIIEETEVFYKESCNEEETQPEIKGGSKRSDLVSRLERLQFQAEELQRLKSKENKQIDSQLKDPESYKLSVDDSDSSSIEKEDLTRAKMLGMVISDFLSGMSKNKVDGIQNIVNSLKAFFESSDFSEIKDSPVFKQLIYYLSEKVKSEGETPTFQIDITHNNAEHSSHSYHSSLHTSSYSSKSETIRTVGGEMSRAEWERRRKAEKEERDRQNALHDATREAVRYSELEAIRAAREEKERNAMIEKFRRKHPK